MISNVAQISTQIELLRILIEKFENLILHFMGIYFVDFLRRNPKQTEHHR